LSIEKQRTFLEARGLAKRRSEKLKDLTGSVWRRMQVKLGAEAWCLCLKRRTIQTSYKKTRGAVWASVSVARTGAAATSTSMDLA
jgi:hypothetical protein